MKRLILLFLLATSVWQSHAQTSPMVTGVYDRELDRFVITVEIPPGPEVYSLMASTDLRSWGLLRRFTESGEFIDAESGTLPRRYYSLGTGGKELPVLGYIKVEYTAPDFRLFSDPFLTIGTDWSSFLQKIVGSVEPGVLEGAQVLLWEPDAQQSDLYAYDFGELTPIPPPYERGRGFGLRLADDRQIIFSGYLPEPEEVDYDLPAGTFLLGSVTSPSSPEELLPTVPYTSASIPDGSMIHAWDEESGQMATSVYESGQWSPSITVQAGHAYWLELSAPWDTTPPPSGPFSGMYDRTLNQFVVFINVPGSALEASRDLATWSVLSENPGTEFIDAEAGSLPWRYYRLTPGDGSGTVIGYIRIEAGPGFSFLSDPFVPTEPEWPAFLYYALNTPHYDDLDGSQLFFWEASSQRFSGHLQDLGEFAPQTFPPKDSRGFALRLTSGRTMILTGEVPRTPIEHSYPPGLYLQGSVFTAASADTLLPNVPEGSMLFLWDSETQNYQTSLYDFGEWWPALTIMPGQSYWVLLNEPASWTQSMGTAP